MFERLRNNYVNNSKSNRGTRIHSVRTFRKDRGEFCTWSKVKWRCRNEGGRKEQREKRKVEWEKAMARRVSVVATAVTLEIALLLLRRVEKLHRVRFSGRGRARATQANVRSWLSCGLPPAMGSVSASLLMASRSNRIRNRRRSS